MSALDERSLVGTRQPDFPHGINNDWTAWPPGSYGFCTTSGRTGGWWIVDPAGSFGRLANHDVVEHDDGTITVQPSIYRADGYHGWLRRGIWHAERERLA